MNLFFFKLGMILDATELYIWILVWLTLTYIQGHRGAKKQNLTHKFISESSYSVWMEFVTMLRLVGMMRLMIILSHVINIQRRERYVDDFHSRSQFFSY